MTQTFERQDIGYLLTAYADGQLAPEGVMWVEEQLDRNPDLRARLKEIRHLQASLRTAFAGGAPEFVLDLPRREAVLASAANPPRKKISFPSPLWIGLAASVMAIVYVGMQMSAPLLRSEAYAVHDKEEAGVYGLAPTAAQPTAPAPAAAAEVHDNKYYADGPVSGFKDDEAQPRLARKSYRSSDETSSPGNYEWKSSPTSTVKPAARPAAPAVPPPPSVITPKPDSARLARVDGGRTDYDKPGEESVPVTSGMARARAQDKSQQPEKPQQYAYARDKFKEKGNREGERLNSGDKTIDSTGKKGSATTTPIEQLPVTLSEANGAALETAASEDAALYEVAKGPEGAVSNSTTGYAGSYNAFGSTNAKDAERFANNQPASGGQQPARAGEQLAKILRDVPIDGNDDQSFSRRNLSKAEQQLEQKRLEAENGDAAERLELVRQSNNEKTHIAQVTRAVAGQLNRKLAEVEDDLNKSTTAQGQGESQKANEKAKIQRQVEEQAAQLAIAKQRHPEVAGSRINLEVVLDPSGDEELDNLRRRSVEQHAELEMIKERFPKIAAEISDEKASASFLQGVVGAVRHSPQGDPELLMLTLGKGDQVAEGTEFIIFRGHDYIVRVRAEKIMGEMVACRIIADSWNSRGLAIQQGDLAQNRLGGELPSAISARPLLASNVDPLQSLAALRAPVTLDGTLGLAQSLRLIGGEKIGYTLTSGVQGLLERQVQVSLRDEPAARGVLRAVRSAGLQAQFTGGVVRLDAAMRPLDPADTQGFDLPTFKDLFGTSPMQVTAVDAIQTVAIDADTASYDYAKARIAAGQQVDPATIKPEHFINAMPMDYPAAQGPEAFTLYAEAAPSPFARANTAWGARTALVSIGAVAKPAAADERKPLALTLAIDCSGSMAQAGGLDRIQRGLMAFIEHLRAEDRVSIVAFGDQARVILPATPGNDQNALRTAVMNLSTGGATNAAEGLGLAYQLAAETATVGVESRVLLATDGGTVAAADDLLRRVTAFKDRGITLVVVGTGQTYRAGPLQDLATKGDGQHFYVGSDEDAQALFTGKLLPDRIAVLAKDAKLQVTWNPQRVSHARLIGYDQRRLAAKDFRDNSVDAGELSQDTQVTALFEVLLVDGGAGPLGTAAVRYQDMRREQVRELACPLPGTILQSQASDRLRLLACAAATAEWLQRGWWSNVHLITPEEIRAQLARCPQPIANELRAMVK